MERSDYCASKEDKLDVNKKASNEWVARSAVKRTRLDVMGLLNLHNANWGKTNAWNCRPWNGGTAEPAEPVEPRIMTVFITTIQPNYY